MEVLGYIFLIGYVIALAYVTIFCLMQFHLLYHFLSKNKGLNAPDTNITEWPLVTVQLPIFNERYVVERLIDCICSLDYPKAKLQIHILDDSTDQTLQLSQAKAASYRQMGFDIEVIRREDRKGYKAGALKEGMKYAKGTFIAIFDADFLPETDFLKRSIPHFSDSSIGVVQTRWSHINQKYSLLTELQAFQLNVHFTIEQGGRDRGNFLLQFNGTAGVWRRETIEDAGGWEADTLTEDLDLSYRAQLKGWKIKFLVDVTAPAELPAEIYGLKSQQHRWMKGGAETCRKLLPQVWSSNLPLGKKLHGTIHLLSSSVFLFVFFLGLFSVPLIFLLSKDIDLSFFSMFMVSLLLLVIIYYIANVHIAWHKGSKVLQTIKFVLLFPIFLAVSMGLSLHNSIAVLQGFFGQKSAFIRTPKYGIKTGNDSFFQASYLKTKISGITLVEGLLCLLFAAAAISGLVIHSYNFVAFHIMLAIGYGTTFFYSIKHLAK